MGKEKGHEHTVYSQMNERVTGGVMKKIMSKNKNQRQPKSASLSLERSPVPSYSGVLFFLLFPAILPIPTQPSLLPKSIPYWSPFSSLPPPVFLASAGTLSPTSFSLSLFRCLSRFLPQTMLSIFPSFFASVPFICPFIGHSFPFL